MRSKEEILKDGTRKDILCLEVLLDIREILQIPTTTFTAVSEPVIEIKEDLLPFEPKIRRKKRNTEVN